MGDPEQRPVDFFISRAGADAAFAAEVGRILEAEGNSVVLQQWDFANRNFMERMHRALGSGARVIALLSDDYLNSDHCEAEWLNAIAQDPLNKKGRLIVTRVGECVPTGLLTALAYWDLVPVRDDPALVRDIVLAAITPGRHKPDAGPAGPYWREARSVVHREIRATPSFTGREGELAAINAALWSGEAAAVTQPASVHGLGGIGKSVLAREYAFRARDRYAGVWWLERRGPRTRRGSRASRRGWSISAPYSSAASIGARIARRRRGRPWRCSPKAVSKSHGFWSTTTSTTPVSCASGRRGAARRCC